MNIVRLPTITTAEHNPDDILEAAKGRLDRVTVIGVTDEGELWLSGSQSDLSLSVMDIEMAKAWMVREALAASDDLASK